MTTLNLKSLQAQIDAMNEEKTNAKIDELTKHVESLTTLVNELQLENAELKTKKVRNRGPKSTRKMTDDDARRIFTGDLADASHNECATTLELSYGQIYSARLNHTFRHIARK